MYINTFRFCQSEWMNEWIVRLNLLAVKIKFFFATKEKKIWNIPPLCRSYGTCAQNCRKSNQFYFINCVFISLEFHLDFSLSTLGENSIFERNHSVSIFLLNRVIVCGLTRRRRRDKTNKIKRKDLIKFLISFVYRMILISILKTKKNSRSFSRPKIR